MKKKTTTTNSTYYIVYLYNQNIIKMKTETE